MTRRMTEQAIAELKDIIQLRIDCLLVMIDGNAQSVTPKQQNNEPNNMFEPDSATLDTHALEGRAIEQAQQELTQLTRALSWLETESAGTCEQCGGDIGISRLKTVPTTRACAECAKSLKK